MPPSDRVVCECGTEVAKSYLKQHKLTQKHNTLMMELSKKDKKPEPKPAPVPEPKPVPKPEPKPAPKPAPVPEPKPAPKPEPKNDMDKKLESLIKNLKDELKELEDILKSNENKLELNKKIKSPDKQEIEIRSKLESMIQTIKNKKKEFENTLKINEDLLSSLKKEKPDNKQQAKQTITEAIKSKKARTELNILRDEKFIKNINLADSNGTKELKLNDTLKNRIFKYFSIISPEQKRFYSNYVVNVLTNSFGFKIDGIFLVNWFDLDEGNTLEETLDEYEDIINLVSFYIYKIEKEIHGIKYTKFFEKQLEVTIKTTDWFTFNFLLDHYDIDTSEYKRDKIIYSDLIYEEFKDTYLDEKDLAIDENTLRTFLISTIIEDIQNNPSFSEDEKVVIKNEEEKINEAKQTISQAIKNKKAQIELNILRDEKLIKNIDILDSIGTKELKLNDTIKNRLFRYYKIVSAEQKRFYSNYIVNTLTNSFGFEIPSIFILNILNIDQVDTLEEFIDDNKELIQLVSFYIYKIEKEIHGISYNKDFEKHFNKTIEKTDWESLTFLTDYLDIDISEYEENDKNLMIVGQLTYTKFKDNYLQIKKDEDSLRTNLIANIIEEAQNGLIT